MPASPASRASTRNACERWVSFVALCGVLEQAVERGVIDTYHVAYFVFFIGFFSFLTLRSMEARKWTGRR